MSHELIALVLEKIANIRGLEVKYRQPEPVEGNDGELELHYPGGDARFRLEIRKQITTTTIKMMMSGRTPDQFHHLLLITPQITPVCAELLKAHDICYADAAGNLFLHAGPLYLNITGHKTRSKDLPTGLMPIRQSFAANALKIIFAILTDPDLDRHPDQSLLNQNYRTVGRMVGLPLGSIATTLSALQAGGYIVTGGAKGAKLLLERKKLMTRWIEDYAARLRPRLITGHYRMPSARWWEKTDIRQAPGLWGGEIAGAKLTQYLSPETGTLYTKNLSTDFILQTALYKDPAGTVEVLQPFWGPIPWAQLQDCVHPLLVYADLMASEIDRNVDTAERVYAQYLRQIIEPA